MKDTYFSLMELIQLSYRKSRQGDLPAFVYVQEVYLLRTSAEKARTAETSPHSRNIPADYYSPKIKGNVKIKEA